MPRFRRVTAVLGVVPLALAVSLPAPGAHAAAPPAGPAATVAAALATTPDADGLHVVSATAIDARLLELMVTTSAVAGPQRVRVLLPTTYGPKTRYPVIYLLHGSAEDATAWSARRNAEAVTAALPVIVVMPDAGTGGEYTDWVGQAMAGAQQWETFHVHQLLPWIDAHLPTIATRAGRALTGESMGGLGTMEYASRYPDLFAAAAPLSGAVSLVSPTGQAGVSFNETLEAVVPGTIYGDRATDELGYRGHSPVDLVMNTAATQLFIYTHTGVTGGTCNPGGDGPADVDAVEYGVHAMSQELDAALTAQKLPHLYDDLGAGSHVDACFSEELALAVPKLAAVLAKPAAAPSTVSYASTAPTWSQWGWTVAVQRPAAEFSVLRDAGATGFSLLGSGTATVTTPAVYKADTAYRVTVTPSAAGLPGAGATEPGCVPATTGALPTCASPAVAPDAVSGTFAPGTPVVSSVTADASGRLTLDVPLGAGNPLQEFTVPGVNSTTTIFRTAVAIAPVAGAAAPAPVKGVTPPRPVSPKRGVPPARIVTVTLPARTLAFTGASPLLGATALTLLGLGGALARRRCAA